MERSMENISWKDMKTNVWVRQQTGVKDLLTIIKKAKWRWAGHVSRMKDERWTNKITYWDPMEWRRQRGRPTTRWRDDLDKYWKSVNWRRNAEDRRMWKIHGEAYLQKWSITG